MVRKHPPTKEVEETHQFLASKNYILLSAQSSKSEEGNPMIRTDEVRRGEGQIQFALAALGENRLRSKSDAPHEVAPAVAPSIDRNGINLSHTQLLIAFLFALSLTSLFVWGWVRYWLFAQ